MADEHSSAQQPQGKDTLIPGVKHVIAISSGKGGVGKSTVAANLACALALTGAKVGLMDADVYGPNIPMMMGSTTGPEQRDGKIVPVENYGVKLISMAFLVPEEAPIVWRGPMVHQYLQAFFRDVLWGELDYLLIDLPPGTGDVQLSLSQMVPLAGAVTVTTPQEVALYDVRKGMAMFQKVNVPAARHYREHELVRVQSLRRAHRHFFPRGRGAGRVQTRRAVPRQYSHRSRHPRRRRQRTSHRGGESFISSRGRLQGHRQETRGAVGWSGHGRCLNRKPPQEN